MRGSIGGRTPVRVDQHGPPGAAAGDPARRGGVGRVCPRVCAGNPPLVPRLGASAGRRGRRHASRPAPTGADHDGVPLRPVEKFPGLPQGADAVRGLRCRRVPAPARARDGRDRRAGRADGRGHAQRPGTVPGDGVAARHVPGGLGSGVAAGRRRAPGRRSGCFQWSGDRGGRSRTGWECLSPRSTWRRAVWSRCCARRCAS